MEHTHSLASLGSLILLVAVVVSVALGVTAFPAVPSIAIGAGLFLGGYFLVRLPQMLGMLQEQGARSVGAMVVLFAGYSIGAAILYGIGRLFS